MGTLSLCTAPCVSTSVSTGDPLAPAARTPWHGLALPCSSVWPVWLVAAWPSLGTGHHWMECLLHLWDDSGLVPCLGDSGHPPRVGITQGAGTDCAEPCAAVRGDWQVSVKRGAGGKPCTIDPALGVWPLSQCGGLGESLSLHSCPQSLHLTWLCR